MNVTFLDPAERELDEAFDYYQNIMDGLGFRFIDEITKAIERIKHFPMAHPSIGKYSNRCLVNKFPYGLIFKLRNDDILIVAVSNLHRQPSYWHSRES